VTRWAGWLATATVVLLLGCTPRLADPDRAGPHAGISVAHALTTPALNPARDPSPGCRPAPVAALPPTLRVAGRERRYLLHAPATMGSAPRSLVIAFHGRSGNAAAARAYFGLEAALPEAVIVYPEAWPVAPGASSWYDPGDPAERQRDFAFVSALVEAVGAAHCLDGNRLFLVGHSLGAYFANDLACYLGGRVRAVASVAGGLLMGSCAGANAALLLHHPEDALVPIDAGELARDAFLRANGLAGSAAQAVAEPALATAGCLRYGPANHPHPVYWCALQRTPMPFGRPDPHSWPAEGAAAIASFLRGLP